MSEHAAAATEVASPCERLIWDSEFFGFPIGRVVPAAVSRRSAEHAASWAERERIRCTYCLLDARDRASGRAVESVGFRCVDVRVVLECTAAASPASMRSSAAEIGAHRASETAALCRIASEVHDQTRFYRDGLFPRGRCDALYATWIRNSCAGAADLVLVARRGGQPVGYSTCHRSPDGTGRLGLLGVAWAVRRSGIGGALVTASLTWFRTQGITQVRLVTQGRNMPAMRLYAGHQFRMVSVQTWWHLWT